MKYRLFKAGVVLVNVAYLAAFIYCSMRLTQHHENFPTLDTAEHFVEQR